MHLPYVRFKVWAIVLDTYVSRSYPHCAYRFVVIPWLRDKAESARLAYHGDFTSVPSIGVYFYETYPNRLFSPAVSGIVEAMTVG